MGTYYRIETHCHETVKQNMLEERLESLVSTFSTYEPQSHISQLNQSPLHEWQPINGDFGVVSQMAIAVYDESEGAFDPTVYKLVERMGFGAADVEVTSEVEELPDLPASIGFDLIEFDFTQQRVRKNGNVGIDYSGIAKGYAVDSLAELLLPMNCLGFLVDIGGEIRTHGLPADRDMWRVAVQHPINKDAMLGYIEMNDGALATSGTYTNSRKVDGSTISHLMSPREAAPISHDTVSVTVYAESAAWADAWSTALIVKGSRDGKIVAETAGIDAVFVDQSHQGTLAFTSTGRLEELFKPSTL